MTQAKVVERVNADADAVWTALSDFGGVQPGGFVEAVDVEGDGVGMLRHIRVADGTITERLETHDAEQRTFSYAIINEDCPLPFADYSAEVVVSDNGDDSATVEWTGTFEPKGVDEATAVKMATGIYTGAIQGARKALGG